jgi:hypothetical protein
MLNEMMSLVKGNLDDDGTPEGSNEEEKENSDKAYDDSESSDDDFNDDRDVSWDGARQRKKSKSPIRSHWVKPQKATIQPTN